MRQHDEVDSRRVRRSVATELSEDLAFLKHLIYVNNHYALASSNEKALSGFPDRASFEDGGYLLSHMVSQYHRRK